MTVTDEALVEQLRSEHGTLAGLIEASVKASDRIEALTAENERLNKALKECVMEAADWARQAGEAKGKLEGSEMPGIVDGWKAENQELRSKIARLRDAGDRLAVFVRHNPRCAISRGRDQCNCDHDIVLKAWKETRAALKDKP